MLTRTAAQSSNLMSSMTRPERSYIQIGNFLQTVDGPRLLEAAPSSASSSPGCIDPKTEKLNQYKLDAVFHGDLVFHTTALVAGKVVSVPRTAWRRGVRLGAGASGVVWREMEHGSGQLRAVKVVSKLQLNVRELEALVELQDVGRQFHWRGKANALLAPGNFHHIFGLVRGSSRYPHRDGVHRAR